MKDIKSDGTSYDHSVDFSYLDEPSDPTEDTSYSPTSSSRSSYIDPMFRGASSPELLKKIYPDARPSTWKDGIRDLLIIVLLCVVMIIYSLAITVTHYQTAKFEEDTIKTYDQVEGVMTHVFEDNSDFKADRVDIIYKFYYEGKKYEGLQELPPSTAHNIGAFDREIKGTKVTVYFDPNDPEQSYLAASPYPLLIEWLFPILPTIGIFLGIKVFIECVNGERWVYTRGGVTKIKKFR